jgi:hypothetical protein
MSDTAGQFRRVEKHRERPLNGVAALAMASTMAWSFAGTCSLPVIGCSLAMVIPLLW